MESYPRSCTAPDGTGYPEDTAVMNSGSYSWEEAKTLISSCQVTQTIQLHDGTLQIKLADGTTSSITGYDESELMTTIQQANDSCGFTIIVAME